MGIAGHMLATHAIRRLLNEYPLRDWWIEPNMLVTKSQVIGCIGNDDVDTPRDIDFTRGTTWWDGRIESQFILAWGHRLADLMIKHVRVKMHIITLSHFDGEDSHPLLLPWQTPITRSWRQLDELPRLVLTEQLDSVKATVIPT